MSIRLRSTFPTLCKDITLVMPLFSKSLAIGLPASRVNAYLRRPDSVGVYWTTLKLRRLDYGFVGALPDGLVGSDAVLEVKCLSRFEIRP